MFDATLCKQNMFDKTKRSAMKLKKQGGQRDISIKRCLITQKTRGGSRIFFRRGCTRLLLYFNTNIPHSLFLQNTSCIRKPRVISRGGGGAHLLHPPPRSALKMIFVTKLKDVRWNEPRWRSGNDYNWKMKKRKCTVAQKGHTCKLKMLLQIKLQECFMFVIFLVYMYNL